MEKPDFSKMPWIGDKMKFPRVADDGFDSFDFTPEQVRIIAEETGDEAEMDLASDIIRALAKLEMDSQRDFLKAVLAVTSQTSL